MKKDKSVGLFAVIILLTTNCCGVQHNATSSEQFRGMWKLDRFETLNSTSGQWIADTSRIGYTGFILYDGLGHMGVQQNPPGYRDVELNKSLDSLDNTNLKKVAGLYRSNYVYFGNYKIDGKRIEHQRLSATNPRDWNTVLKRDFEFRGDTLILTTIELVNGSRLRIRWIRF